MSTIMEKLDASERVTEFLKNYNVKVKEDVFNYLFARAAANQPDLMRVSVTQWVDDLKRKIEDLEKQARNQSQKPPFAPGDWWDKIYARLIGMGMDTSDLGKTEFNDVDDFISHLNEELAEANDFKAFADAEMSRAIQTMTTLTDQNRILAARVHELELAAKVKFFGVVNFSVS